VHLFNCATPLLYIYVALLFPRNTPRWVALISCFVMGFLVDIFSNTPGVSMASLTFLGLIQPLVLKLFLQHDSADDMKPSMRTLGIGCFVYYTILMVFVYCLLFFTLETFNFFNWIQWLESIVGSSIITIILILTLANFRSH
ncbi:MAG: rod shape-determining protein MreD, partial [Prevotella salivae]|nr:rod shape-determining protein MreD [Segatella salivae]